MTDREMEDILEQLVIEVDPNQLEMPFFSDGEQLLLFAC